jgi:hypothetical protein
MLVTAFNVTMTLNTVNNIFQIKFARWRRPGEKGPVEGLRPFCDKDAKHAENREGDA